MVWNNQNSADGPAQGSLAWSRWHSKGEMAWDRMDGRDSMAQHGATTQHQEETGRDEKQQQRHLKDKLQDLSTPKKPAVVTSTAQTGA